MKPNTTALSAKQHESAMKECMTVESRSMVIKWIAISMLLVMGASHGRVAQADVTLSKEEAEVVKGILVRDQLMREMSASQTGLSDLNKLLKMTVTGPVKIAIIWNQMAIDAWRKINSKLVIIGKQTTCDEIGLQLVDLSPSRDFFKQLSKARGCDD
jgi:hypothetical protein